MLDIRKQISYWREGALEDIAVADELVISGRLRHGLYFAHLALEKILKAHVCRHTGELAPRLHNLIRLTNLAGTKLTKEYSSLLAEMNEFNIEGRYPDIQQEEITQEKAEDFLTRSKEVFQWLIQQL